MRDPVSAFPFVIENCTDIVLAVGCDCDASFDMGWAVGGAVGYRVGAIRVEGEGAYFSATLGKFGALDIEKDDFDTQPGIAALSLTANGWYEIDTGTRWTRRPHAGNAGPGS